jgi:hypothetical protein
MIMNRSTILFVLCLLVLMVGGLILDDFIPPLQRAFGARLLLVPAIFFACALTVPFPLMLAFAMFAGLGWDARHMVIEDGGNVEFGYTILLFGLTGSLMQGVRPLFGRGRWELPLLLIGVAAMVMLLLEWFLVSFRRGEFEISPRLWGQIWTSSLLCMLISPLLFFLLFKLARATGFPLQMMREPNPSRR